MKEGETDILGRGSPNRKPIGQPRRRRLNAKTQIHISQAAVSAHPILRHVSQTTPSGVSQVGHHESGRSRWRSMIETAGKPVRKVLRMAEHASERVLPAV